MKHSQKEVQDFVEGLYKKSDETIKELLKHQHKGKKQLEEEVMNLIFTYVVENDMMNMSRAEQKKEIRKLDKFIDEFYKADAELQIKLLYSLLEDTAGKAFRFYEYNAEKKEIKNIVKQFYKGRHFSENVWENETQTAKYMKKQLYSFIQGKVNVNQITTNITKLFNNSHFEARRLAQTEVARCQSVAFDRFGTEVGIKKVKYYATLCHTCSKCMADDGKLFDFKNKPELPRHPFCQCYYDIADDYIEISSKMSADASNIGIPQEGNVISNEDFNDFKNSIEELGMRIEGFENYKGDVQILKELAEDLKIIKDTQPSIANMKNGLLIKYEDLGNINDFAISHKKSISLNSKMYNDSKYLKQLYEQSEECGFFVKGTNYRSVIYHEAGHILCSRNLRLQNELEKYIEGKAIESNLSVNDYIIKNISGYAIEKDYRTEKYKELLPEIMSMCYNNGNNKEIGNEILKSLKLR